MPKVSVIIPSYNAAAYVKEAVDSALAQTYPDCEIIVVDDGSTDETKNVLDTYIRENKIVYIHQANKGLAGARNAGIRAARGEYIAFLDADDLFLPDKVKEQVAILESYPDYGVCYSDIMHFMEGGVRQYYHHRYTYPSGDIFEPLLQRQFLNPLALLVRREVFENYGFFDENLRRSEDWDLWLRWARAGVKFYYLNKVLAHYRVHTGGGNLSSLESEPQMKEKNLEIFSRLFGEMTPEERTRYATDRILRRIRIKTAFAYLMVGKKKEALAKLKGVPAYWRVGVHIIPASAWRFILGRLRALKHRLLLKKMYTIEQ